MNPMWTACGTAGVGEFVQGVFLPSPLRDIFQFWFEPAAPRMPALTRELAAVLVFLFVFWSLLVVSAGILVWIGASRERRIMPAIRAVRNISLNNVMITSFHSLNVDDSLGEAADHALRSLQADFPILDGVRLSGVLTREEVLTAMERHGPRRVLGEVMRPVRKAAKSTDTISSALRTLEMTGAGFLPVFEQGTMAGLVTTENLKAYIRFHLAQHSYKKTALHGGQTGVLQRVEAVRRV
jgi:CBS domain-containing protein